VAFFVLVSREARTTDTMSMAIVLGLTMALHALEAMSFYYKMRRISWIVRLIGGLAYLGPL